MAMRDCYENQEAGFAVPFTGEIHPVADLFPMMTDDELDDLAADIKANGLIHPIVLDDEGRLIDGRNRLAGCQRAGVEPICKMLDGHDPVAFILSANVTRRHLSKGQQAMAVASAERFLKKQTVREAAAAIGLHSSRIAYANVVLEYAHNLAAAVLSGDMPLNEAYDIARRAKVEQESVTARIKTETDERDKRVRELRKQAPDLAERVDLGFDLDEAFAALEERKRKEEQQVRSISENLATGLLSLDPGRGDPQKTAETWLAADPRFLGTKADFSADRARRVAAALVSYADLKENEGDVKSI